MLRKMFSLGALIVVAVTFGVGSAAAKSGKPAHPGKAGGGAQTQGFSDGRMSGADPGGMSDGRI